MAGTLTISTLSDGTNSTSATNPIKGSAKAWVNFNGSTAVIRGSYNVSSITRSGVGDYTINFTNNLSNANYCVTSMSGQVDNGGANRANMLALSTQTTSSFRVLNTLSSTTGLDDAPYNGLSVLI